MCGRSDMLKRLVSRIHVGSGRIQVGLISTSGQAVINTAKKNFDDHRSNRTYFHEVYDTLWKCRRGVITNVEPKSILIDAPRLTMRYRVWSEFIEDGLLSVWLKQTLRDDVLASITGPRLAYMMGDTAKVVGAEKNDGLGARGLSSEDTERLCILTEKTIRAVLIRNSGSQFKHISAAVEASGRISELLQPPKDQVEKWSKPLQEWITSGELSIHLAPLLAENRGELKSIPFGPTSLSGFLRGMCSLDYKPDDDTLRQLAHCSCVVFPFGGRYLRSKALINYLLAWHGWKTDPDGLWAGSWSVWFKAYEQLLRRPFDLESEKPSQISNLIRGALLIAKDYGQMDELKRVLELTEAKLEEIVKIGSVPRSTATKLVDMIDKIHIRTGESVIRDQLMQQLRSRASSL